MTAAMTQHRGLAAARSLLVAALLLAFSAYLAYLAVPELCFRTRQYQQAFIRRYSRADVGSSSSSSQGSNSSRSSASRPPATASARDTFDASMLWYLLPHTNFAHLQSAVVLDAAAAVGVDQQGQWQLIQMQHTLFCR